MAGLLALAAMTTVEVSVGSSASAVDPTYTVTVGAKGAWSRADDTPAGMYIDKDGSFWYQQAHALYQATQGRKWSFYTGTDMDSTSLSSVSSYVNPANSNDQNGDTTWRCENSPTGVESSFAVGSATYARKNYCDLAGVWVDPDTGDWYGLVHNEFTPQPFADGLHYDSIDLTVSADQGRTWDIREHIITSPYSTVRGDTAAFPQQTYYYGDGDPRLLVDAASGYFYVFYGSRVVDKGGSWKAFHEHVARAPIGGKMAKGSWQKWYGGAWSQPGVGGKESNMVPVDGTNTTGYTPTSAEYNPASTGTTAQQVAAGTMPATSPLFVMDVTYNAYLGLYIGEPQAVDQSGNAPQQFYATDNLATQKWKLVGDTGAYTNASWYRWFVDSGSRTSSQIVGKNFRSYCSFGCSGGTSGEYVNVAIDSSSSFAVVDTSTAYRIQSGGRMLAQVSGSTATTSVTTDNGLASWAFAANGDGSYRITNTTTNQLLGVATTSASTRAWGTQPTAMTASGSPTVGQQWFIIRNTSAADGSQLGTYRLVNRYSGLVLALSGTTSRLAETTPARAWTDSTGSSVGGGRTASEQTVSLAPVTTPASLAGVHTLAVGGKALDDPGHSTATGTQMIVWTLNGGPNQRWTFAKQPDGYYTLTNGESNLCLDVDGGSSAVGAKIIQWTCHGGVNQRWMPELQADGTYLVRSVGSGRYLTAASTSNGALVTQEAPASGAAQRWALG
jgi:hypothetical protein